MYQSRRDTHSTQESVENTATKPRLIPPHDPSIQLPLNISKTPRIYPVRHERHQYEPDISKIQDSYESLPSFGNEGRNISFGGPNISKNIPTSESRNDDSGRRPRESQARSIEGHKNRLHDDYRAQIEYGNPTLQTSSSTKNLKQSDSYIGAMKALQQKIKDMETQLEVERKNKAEENRKHQREVDVLTDRFDEERRSLLEAEKSLKNKIVLLEGDLKEKEKLLETSKSENDRLRRIGHEVETEKAVELQKALNEQERLKIDCRELEGRLQERMRIEEDLISKNKHLEKQLREKEKEIARLEESMESIDSDKRSISTQIEIKIKDLVLKQKNMEDEKRQIEAEFQEELGRREQREEEMQDEIANLQMHIQELQNRLEHTEISHRDKEVEITDKIDEIVRLKEELERLVQEQEKMRQANERAQLYAQDMAQMNQRLINNFVNKKRTNSRSFETGLPQSTRNGRATQGLQENNGASIDELLSMSFPAIRRHNNNIRIDGPESDAKVAHTTPRDRDTDEKGFYLKGWYLGSPGVRDFTAQERELFEQGPRLKGEDLSNSENLSKMIIQREERKSSRSPLTRNQERTLLERRNREDTETSSAVKARSMYEDRDKEITLEKLHHEIVIKEIIEVEKEVLELNKEYQKISTDIMGLDREREDYKEKKKKIDEIGNKLQEKGSQLINLKKKEEQLVSKFKF